MSTRKTIGGDRLGAGRKMQVEMHGFSRSTHDLSFAWRSTMAAGTLVPFMSLVALPGDTFDIDLEADVQTHPTIGPLFGSYKMQLDVFQAPIRLYNALLHNNSLDVGRDMKKVKFPVIELEAKPIPSNVTDIDNAQVNPSCILSYLGIRGIGRTSDPAGTKRQFNALPILMYWDIYKNYYANKQEEVGAVIHTPSSAIIQTVDDIAVAGGIVVPEAPSQSNTPLTMGTAIEIHYTSTPPRPDQLYFDTLEYGPIPLDSFVTSWWDSGATLSGNYDKYTFGNITILSWHYRSDTDLYNGMPKVETFPLWNLDSWREFLLTSTNTTVPRKVNDQDLRPLNRLWGSSNGIPNILNTQEGLAVKTYQSDLFNNWMATSWIEGPGSVTAATAISTSAGFFTIDTLLLSKKVYDLLNRVAISGGTYDDWIDAAYDHSRYKMATTPMYMGGLIKEVVFQEVISTVAPTNAPEWQPLGTLAGRGKLSNKHKGGQVYIKVDEPSYIIGIVSLTPRVDYSQGNTWDVNLQTMADLHTPLLDEIGYQDLITEQMAWWDTVYSTSQGKWVQNSAGKQPAWVNYMTNVNRVYGNFAVPSNEMFMTLNRRYEYDETDGIVDLTTYIDPGKFNFIFAQTSPDAQNFWVQIGAKVIARRKMSAKIMPNL